MSVEDAGTIEAELRLKLTQMEQDALEAQRKMDELAAKLKEKGKEAGDGFANGFSSGKTRYDASLKTMQANLASLGPWGQRAGTTLANGLSRPVIAAVPKMAMAFRSLQAAMGPIMIVVGLVTSAVMAIKGFVDKQNQAAKEAKEKQEELNKTIDDTKRLYQNMTNSLGMAGQSLQIEVNTRRLSGEALERQIASQERLQRIIASTAEAISNIEVVNSNLLRTNVQRVIAEKSIIPELQAQRRILHDQWTIAQMNGDIAERDAIRLQEIANDKEQDLARAQAELEARQAISDVLLKQYTTLLASADATAEMKAAAERTLDAYQSQVQWAQDYVITCREAVETARQAILPQQQQRSIQADMAKALEAYSEKMREINAQRSAGMIDEEQQNKQLESARSSYLGDLVKIRDAYDEAGNSAGSMNKTLMSTIGSQREILGLAEQTRREEENREKINALLISQNDTLLQQEIESWKAKAAAAKTDAERNAALEEAIFFENRLIDIQRERAWKAIEESREYIAASDDEREAILFNFNRITAGMKKVLEEAENGVREKGSLVEILFGSEETFGYISQAGNILTDAYDTISNEMLEISRKKADEEIAIIEEVLEKRLKAIEDLRNAELIVAGFSVANNAESLEAQLEAAKRTGDEVLIYLAERRLKEQEINDRFDDEAEQAADEAAKKKAEIEYKLAIQEYQNKMINAINAGIMAVINALASPVPWPVAVGFGAAAGIATGTQISLMAANPPQRPKLPTFADSGIVPGNNYFGDRVHAMVDSGELILNRAHQDNIANQLTEKSGPVNATIIMMMDSREIAKNTIELVNDGFYTIKARAVR